MQLFIPLLLPCPKCQAEGRGGLLYLVRGSKGGRAGDRAYELAVCDQDSRQRRTCGYTAPTVHGMLLRPLACPECAQPMRPACREGGHRWLCSACPKKKAFLADLSWRIVSSPTCPECAQPMTHRARREQPGRYFWACFACHDFLASDVFGAIPSPAQLSA